MPVRSLLSSLESQGTMLSPDALDLVQSGDLDPRAVEEGLMALDDPPLVVDASLARKVADGSPEEGGSGGSIAGGGGDGPPAEGGGTPPAGGGDDGSPSAGRDDGSTGSPGDASAETAGAGRDDPGPGGTGPGSPESGKEPARSDDPEAAASPGEGPDASGGSAGSGTALEQRPNHEADPNASHQKTPNRQKTPDRKEASSHRQAPDQGETTSHRQDASQHEEGSEGGLEAVAERAPGAQEREADEVEAPVGSVAEVDYDASDEALPSTDPVAAIDPGDFEPDLEVLRDITGESTCEGELADFTRYFNDRLRRLRKLLGKRREMVGMVPVEKANESRSAEIKFAAMVKDVRTTSSGGRLVEAEDETGVALVFAPDDEDVLEKADAVVEDEVVGFIVHPGNRSSDLLILEDIVHPGVPIQRKGARAQREVAACFISDVHLGARTFLPDDWERFVQWINGQEGTPRMKRLAEKVRYLVVAGDLVEGIGIFPGQREELAVPDGEEQYRLAGQQLARLRDDLTIVVSPGNHDLVRQAEPQPALPEKYARHFPDNVTQVANPCILEVEGVRVLVYHGTGIDDWIQRVSGLTYQEPLGTMKEMLRRHHLLPMYGVKTPIAPEPRDHLVVESVPDVFVSGHVHTAALESWRDVTLINSSCWQGQTPFQKRQGIVPEPGRAAVVELDSGDAHVLDFHRGGEGTA